MPDAPPSASTGRAPIRLLPPAVAARIAAGEVIERPASVVKELVENAIDAGASSIEVLIEGGGCDRIRVRDDGCGIPPAEVADAFERHATSKLRSEHDLFAVHTLGFRGEALAAIAAAADVDFVTRPAAEQAAAVLRYRGGAPDRAGSAAAAPGTSVEVRDLFAALPARRRFLRSPQAEARAVIQAVSAYALAYPGVAFRVLAEGRVVLSTDGGGDLRAAFAAVCGEDLAAGLLPVAADREAEGASAAVRGLAGAPSAHRASRRTLFLFANGRAIVSRALTHAVEEAYSGLLPAGRHPAGILHVTVPPEQVDVNVHPTKAEVRFRHERLVYATVAAGVRATLTGAGTAHAPHGLAVPIAPSADAPAWSAARAVLSGARPAPAAWAAAPDSPPQPDLVASPEGARGVGVDRAAAAGPGAQAALPMHERLPALRALGQVDATYLVAEAPDGLYLVDQHAAHERVLYEQVLAARAAGQPAVQPLLAAVVAPLSAAQAALVAEQAAALAAIGFAVEPTDGAAVLLRAVPAVLARQDPARALVEYLERFEREERLSGPDRAAASRACRGGDRGAADLPARPPDDAASQQRRARAVVRAALGPKTQDGSGASRQQQVPGGAPWRGR